MPLRPYPLFCSAPVGGAARASLSSARRFRAHGPHRQQPQQPTHPPRSAHVEEVRGRERSEGMEGGRWCVLAAWLHLQRRLRLRFCRLPRCSQLTGASRVCMLQRHSPLLAASLDSLPSLASLHNSSSAPSVSSSPLPARLPG